MRKTEVGGGSQTGIISICRLPASIKNILPGSVGEVALRAAQAILETKTASPMTEDVNKVMGDLSFFRGMVAENSENNSRKIFCFLGMLGKSLSVVMTKKKDGWTVQRVIVRIIPNEGDPYKKSYEWSPEKATVTT